MGCKIFSMTNGTWSFNSPIPQGRTELEKLSRNKKSTRTCGRPHAQPVCVNVREKVTCSADKKGFTGGAVTMQET